jgi:hypothetical protein
MEVPYSLESQIEALNENKNKRGSSLKNRHIFS